MEWKKVKSILILIFIGINIFLGIRVYQKNNISVEVKSLTTAKEVLTNRNVILNVEPYNYPTKLKKMNVSNSEKLDIEGLIIRYPSGLNARQALKKMQSDILGDSGNKLIINYTGNKKAIVSPTNIIMNLIRDTKIENTNIQKFELAYKIISNDINVELISAEMEPIWHIEVADGSDYIYSAYSGERI